MSKTKLHQVIAIEKSNKKQSLDDITEVYKTFQKPKLFSGFVKQYTPTNEEGLHIPDERQRVQFHVEPLLARVAETMTAMIDLTARKDWANTNAAADVVVDGETLISDAPATFLLFLEKQLKDLKDQVEKIPELDPAHDWEHDKNTGVWKSKPVSSHRTQKVHTPIVKYDATPEHPAQTEMIIEDQIVGHWKTTRLSGAIQSPRKALLKKRVRKLMDAVKMARAKANECEAEKCEAAKPLFDYLLAE
jgi:hypothetical protein